jgi:hypothetical protein
MIRPLGVLSYPAAHAAWSGVTFLAFAAALWCPRKWWLTTLIAIFAPATMANLLSGQNGFLSAALLVGGIRLAPSRPVLGGILLGLLSYKPQLGVLVVVAVVSARFWRAMSTAAITVVVMILASLVAFGDGPWTAWVRSMPAWEAMWYSERGSLWDKMPTVLSNAVTFGIGLRGAALLQAFVTVLVAAGVWISFRRKPGGSAAAALAVASILATPYAFFYDLTLVAAAVALVIAEYGAALSLTEALVLTAALLLPLGLVLNVHPPISAIVLAALFAMIIFHRERLAA